MITIEHNGKIYNKYNRLWVDENYITIPTSMQNELNYAYFKSLDTENLDVEDLIKLGDDFKEIESYALAIDVYLLVSQKGSEKQVGKILPRITSCYRKLNRPDLVIDILTMAKKKFGKNILTPVLLTSAAAAYCDLNKFEEAKQCCDYAFAMSKGKGSFELAMVYKRINSHYKK